jgi:hypothetical protein
VTDTTIYEYDIALSFAGEDRPYVEAVAQGLADAGVKVFYDQYESTTLWGKDLYTHLRDVYSKRARFTLLFSSEHYAKKVWTNHERESAQARALAERSEYILPARFDDSEIPGLLSTIGYIDLRVVRPPELVQKILEKLGRRPPSWSSTAAAFPGETTSPVESVRSRAVRLAVEAQGKRERAGFVGSEEGVALAQAEVARMRAYIQQEVAELRQLDADFDARFEEGDRGIVLVASARASFTMYWSQQFSNTLNQSALKFREFDFAFSLAGWGQPPVEPHAIVYEFDVDPALHPVWKERSQKGIRLTSKQVADRHLSRVLDRAHDR